MNKMIIFATATMIGCGDKDTGSESDDSATDTNTAADDTSAPIGVEDLISGTISGTVTVQLYETGLDGERDELDWEDSAYWNGVGIDWPFGAIYVGAYHTNASANADYVGSTVINDAVSVNPYVLYWQAVGENSVWVYASIDKYSDLVVGSSDPRGVYPIELPLTEGDSITGADITIIATHRSGTGSACDLLTVSGDAEVTVAYESGNVATMIVSTEGNGPYHVTVDSPEATATGATSSHELTSCQSYGDMKIVGAWDQNNDGLFAPDDTWGTYAQSGVDLNPVTIGATDLTDVNLEIPFGDTPGVNVVPFVSLSGLVNVTGGVFDDLPAGTTVYVAALKYRPTGGFDITTTDSVYDMDTFSWPDLTGETNKAFSLTVPAGTTAYLWAYADVDVDGNVNESGEHVASGGADDNGRVDIGTSSVTDINLSLAVAGS
tara:strand:- start:1185 stop:2489 length:1305 start_codon:yes stop_codon:yes gene_type:complete